MSETETVKNEDEWIDLTQIKRIQPQDDSDDLPYFDDRLDVVICSDLVEETIAYFAARRQRKDARRKRLNEVRKYE